MIYELNGISPEIAPDVFVAPGAHIIGKVRLLPGSSVWFGAVLRGDNEWIEVGEGSNVQENAVFHTDPGFPLIIGKNCTIGHGAILHGCILGDETLIGMGATVLNGVRIGNGCLVGASALVTEGKSFDDGAMIVGAPARTIRTLDAAARQMLKAGAQHYQNRAAAFRSGLKAIR